ncbi:AI-2E family transporter [Dysgonomonas massiliensis]|uniref:AI-2E family transporter n=1 Tax=Dysgonomonas massiliensis TaxID=2040292 RepID=UPI000C783DE1|nr:AI-2E family transporter [Dysgonomonas massiliensis]
MDRHNSKPYTFDRTVRLVISVLLFTFGLYLLYVLRGVLLPFFIAWLVAYMLNPIVRIFKRKLKLPHTFSVIITLFLSAAAIVGVGFALSPLISSEIDQVKNILTTYNLAHPGEDNVTMIISKFVSENIDFGLINNSLSKETIVETIKYVSPALEGLYSSTVSVIVGMTVIFLIMLYIIFILLDYDKINALWRYLIPPKYRATVIRVVEDVEHNMNKYFRNQAFICLILSVLYATGFQLIGLPMAIIFGIIVGMMHMIPYLQVVSFPIAALLCWLGASQDNVSFWGIVGLTILIYIIVQIIMDLFLIPRIMGKAMGLNPAIILLSLSVWGSLLGIVGMIIAIPLTTLLLAYYKEMIASYEEAPEHINPLKNNQTE